MINEIESLIKSDYDFSELVNFRQEHLGGLMNENYSFESSNKKYFVKLYKHYPESKIRLSHILIEHLTQKGVGTYELIANNKGSTLTKNQDHLFEVSKFISDATSGINLSSTKFLIKEMAHGLAAYHSSVHDLTLPMDFINVFDHQNTEKDFFRVREKIMHFAKWSDFDRLCLEMVNLKLKMMGKVPQILTNIQFDQFPVLVNHGDFLTGNCLFDEYKKIKYVIDFEHIINTYRLWDVIKTGAFLSRKNKHEIFHSSIDLDLLLYYLKQYHQKNPLTSAEIEALPSLCVVAATLSDLVLYGYYLAGNPKVKDVASRSKIEWVWWFDNEHLVRSKLHKDNFQLQ